MSKLANLAKKRALQKQQQDQPDSISLLDRLQAKSTESPPTPSAEQQPKVGLSKLASLAVKSKIDTTSKPALNSLRTRHINSNPPKSLSDLSASSSSARSTPAASISTSSASPTPHIPIQILPSVDYTTPFRKRLHSTSFGSVLTPIPSKTRIYNKQRLTSHSNFLYPLASSPIIKPAFSKPSPDEIVSNAQSNFKAKENDTMRSFSSLKISEMNKVLKYNVVSEIEKQAATAKPTLCFVVIGHVDAGKSTLMGRLLLDCGAVSQHTIEKYEQAAKQIGKQSFALAWVMDKTQDERNRGITVDVCTSTFETAKTQFTILDAPGHRDFVPNMIDGSSRADAALLVIDSGPNAFESGFFSDGQTREHAIVARSLGIEKLVVAVNKMDTQNWNEARFQVIEDQFGGFLTKLGFKPENVTFVPCAGLSGENVVKKSKNEALTSWYKGTSLLETLENIKLDSVDYSLPFRMRIVEVDSVPHVSQLTVGGRINSGTVQVNQDLLLIPSKKHVTVTKIFSYDRNGKELEWAKAGDYVEFFIQDSALATSNDMDSLTMDDIRHGDIICDDKNPVPSTRVFTAKITVFETPKPILRGVRLVMHSCGSATEIRFTKLISILEKGQVKKNKPMSIKSGQTAMVQVELLDPCKTVPLERFSDNKDLGRIIFRREGSTIAVGIVEELM